MSNDPHRDALAAALMRLDALEQENRALREGSTGVAVPTVFVPLPISTEPVDQAIDLALQHLSARLDASERQPESAPEPAREPAPAPRRKQPRVKCMSCGSERTLEASLVKGGHLVVEHHLLGGHDLDIKRARACADCGHVVLVLALPALEWLDTNYLSTLIDGDDGKD